MNEASGGEPHFELPKTPAEQGGEKFDDEIEKGHGAASESAVGKQAPSTTPTTPAQPPTQLGDQTAVLPPQTTTPAAKPSTPPATADLEANDLDLIEKQWVNKAKQIVAQTQDDPHKQKDEVSKIKADYIHKRFKKVIKTDEAPA